MKHTETIPRAFVVERPRTDVSKAERYGELVTLFGGSRGHTQDASQRWAETARPPSVVNVTQYADAVARRLDELGFNPAADFFVMSGGTLQVAITTAVLAARHSEFRMLVFAAHLDDYLERTYATPSRSSPSQSQQTGEKRHVTRASHPA
jgi:hypothetical protein